MGSGGLGEDDKGQGKEDLRGVDVLEVKDLDVSLRDEGF